MSFKSGLKAALAVCWRNRSKIETGAGLLLMAAGTGVIMSKAKKAADISYELEARLDDFRVRDAEKDWEDKKERSRAKRDIAKYAICEYTKTYWLGVLLEVGGATFITVSDITQSKENKVLSGLLASYAATLTTVKQRVIEDQGEEKWQEYLLGPQFTTVDVLPDGTVVQTTNPVANPNAEAGLPPHCFFFDERNYNWEKDARLNRDFLETHLRWLNEKLWVEGFLFENDIRRDLGEPIVKSGWTSGIFATDKDGNRNYISFGLDAKNPAAQRFRDGVEPSILIQLNVEDNIIEQIQLPLI